MRLHRVLRRLSGSFGVRVVSESEFWRIWLKEGVSLVLFSVGPNSVRLTVGVAVKIGSVNQWNGSIIATVCVSDRLASELVINLACVKILPFGGNCHLL